MVELVFLYWIVVYVITLFPWNPRQSFSSINNLYVIPRSVYYVLILFLAVVAGFRNFSWPDTASYVADFIYDTPSLRDFTVDSYRLADLQYSERGFYLFSSCIKTLTSNVHFYFILISIVTIAFIAKSLNKYCVYPLLGLLVYISRFFIGRQMMQIRAGLAIAIVVWALQYIEKRKFWNFLIIVLIAFTLHHSVILILPVYWMHKIPFTFKHIVYILFFSFVIAGVASGFIVSHVTNFSSDMNLATTYTSETSQYTQGKGLLNPMLYYQSVVLLLYSYYGKKLSSLTPSYETIRNGYLYSTVILIVLSSFGTLSARISTIYSTFEIFMLPSFLLLFSNWKKLFAWIFLGLIVSGLFLLNVIGVQQFL